MGSYNKPPPPPQIGLAYKLVILFKMCLFQCFDINFSSVNRVSHLMIWQNKRKANGF